jgi:DNA invertase Pin-like site-specific DNA recombinase
VANRHRSSPIKHGDNRPEARRLYHDPLREEIRHHYGGPRGVAHLLEFLREGDVLMVTRIDRLARSIGDLQDIVRSVRAKGASLRATEQPIDTSTAAGKCFLDMLGVFAEFETNLRRERQLEGIAKSKVAGVYKGRPASIDMTKVREMKANGLGASEIAKAMKIGRASVYRALGEQG